MPSSWLVVGLGNPGPEYEFTPHNLGFLVADRLAERNRIRITRREALALVGIGDSAGNRVIVAKPQTFMNESGPSVARLLEKHELGLDRLLLVYDELALPWASLRIREKGSAGGHNGMISVIRSLGSSEFARLRVGVQPEHPLRGGKEYLLSPIRRALRKELEEVRDRAAQAVESIIAEGVAQSMTKFNRRARGLMNEEE